MFMFIGVVFVFLGVNNWVGGFGIICVFDYIVKCVVGIREEYWGFVFFIGFGFFCFVVIVFCEFFGLVFMKLVFVFFGFIVGMVIVVVIGYFEKSIIISVFVGNFFWVYIFKLFLCG